jgi:uncharacterized delta-60 repeat protein
MRKIIRSLVLVVGIIALGNWAAGQQHPTGDCIYVLTNSSNAGCLDPSYGASGKVVSTVDGIIRDMAIQIIGGEQRIVAVGEGNDNATWKVVRFRENGSLDTTFGTAGVITKGGVPTLNAWARKVVVQPDNKIVVVGGTQKVATTRKSTLAPVLSAITRYNENGTPDKCFGNESCPSDGDGTVTLDLSPAAGSPLAGRAEAVVLQPDGKIVVVGGYSSTAIVAARLNLDGSSDSTFGQNGKSTIYISNQPNFVYAATLQTIPSTGKQGVVIAADTSVRLPDMLKHRATLLRITADGLIDATFGAGGVVIADFEDFVTDTPIISHDFKDVTIDANSKVLAGGAAETPGPAYWQYLAMARYDSDGRGYDATFNLGQPLLQKWMYSSCIHSIRVDSNGRILACGHSLDYGHDYFTCGRYLDSGEADLTFGPTKSGWLTTAIPDAGGQFGYAMVRQSDGKFVVGGFAWITTVIRKNQSTSKHVFALARYYED